MKQNDTFFLSFMTPQEDKLYNKPAGADRKDGPMCQYSMSRPIAVCRPLLPRSRLLPLACLL